VARNHAYLIGAGMQVRTYTDLWKWQRKLYAIQDWVLPVPVPVVQGLAAAAVALLWIPLVDSLGLVAMFAMFGTYSTGMTAILLAGPPCFAGWAVSRPMVEGRTLAQHLIAAGRYRATPTRLVRMDRPIEKHTSASVRCEVWTPKGTA